MVYVCNKTMLYSIITCKEEIRRIAMKKYIVLSLLTLLICSSTVSAKNYNTPELSNAIGVYKSGNYAESFSRFNEIVRKDSSNALALYYLAITAAQIGRKDTASSAYKRVLELAPEGSKLKAYAKRGATCLDDPVACRQEEAASEMDKFIQQTFGSGFSEKARSEYEKLKIENMMREMDRNGDIPAQRFREYKDFSSMNNAPSNDEIVNAFRVLQRAGFTNLLSNSNNNVSELSLLTGAQGYDTNSMFGLLGNRQNSSLSPQVIQALLTNQMSTGF